MSTWSIPIDALASKAKADINAVVRKVTVDLFSTVVLKSPVDTGRFRANWNVSFGQPDYAISEITDQSRGAQQAASSASLPTGGIVYLSNGLPYALRLEQGYSKQAPFGMVATTVVEFQDVVNRALAKS